MPFELILFDFSGTLAKLNFRPKKFFSKLNNFGIKVESEEKAKEIFKFLGNLIGFCDNWQELTEKFLEKYFFDFSDNLSKKLTNFFKEEIKFVLFSDSKYVFSLPIKKAVLSGNSRFLIENVGLPKSIKIFTPVETKYVKPDPRAFLVPLKEFNVEPKKVLMVGDEIERDLIPAKKLGMEAILIDRENKFKNPPVKKIKTLKKIKEFLV